MMMAKKLLSIFVVLLTISLMITACFVEYDPTDVPEGVQMVDSSGNPISGGPETGESPKGKNGSVKVTVTLTNGYISEVGITHQEDTGYVGWLRSAPDWIKQANSFNIDALSAATGSYAKPAVKEAGNKALYVITKGLYGEQ
jgi:uncharacterized protein with FMN-binding domain